MLLNVCFVATICSDVSPCVWTETACCLNLKMENPSWFYSVMVRPLSFMIYYFPGKYHSIICFPYKVPAVSWELLFSLYLKQSKLCFPAIPLNYRATSFLSLWDSSIYPQHCRMSWRIILIIWLSNLDKLESNLSRWQSLRIIVLIAKRWPFFSLIVWFASVLQMEASV